MAEEEQQNPETQPDEEPQAEETPAEEPQAEESPAEEPTAPEPQADEAPAEEPPAEEALSEDAATEGHDEAEASAEPEAPTEQPAAEQKGKAGGDLPPGADLDPIALEQPDTRLSAEERARLEAEEEERRSREAELAADGDEEPAAASRAPAAMESGARYFATGKRKTSIARVILTPGSGTIEVNGRSLDQYFPRPLHQTMASQPLSVTGYEGTVDVRVRVHGGGIGGQAGAVRHGVARALTEIDPGLRGDLKRRGFLTRDARVKERRKAGLKKARKRPQFSKR